MPVTAVPTPSIQEQIEKLVASWPSEATDGCPLGRWRGIRHGLDLDEVDYWVQQNASSALSVVRERAESLAAYVRRMNRSYDDAIEEMSELVETTRPGDWHVGRRMLRVPCRNNSAVRRRLFAMARDRRSALSRATAVAVFSAFQEVEVVNDPDVDDLVIAMSNDADALVRAWVAFALGRLPWNDSGISGALGRLAGDGDLEVRCQALLACGHRREPGTLERLEAELASANSDIRLVRAAQLASGSHGSNSG